jgi:hypothetical protein
MTKCGVVHANIRADWEKTNNISYHKIESELELCLNDSESFVIYKKRFITDTAFKFLWWQLMLIAYKSNGEYRIQEIMNL